MGAVWWSLLLNSLIGCLVWGTLFMVICVNAAFVVCYDLCLGFGVVSVGASVILWWFIGFVLCCIGGALLWMFLAC